MSMQSQKEVPVPAVDSIAAILADMPNQTASDFRKRATLAEACLSIADLIQSGTLTERDEVLAAFRIETANLRTDADWHAIQKRIEVLLRDADGRPDEQEALLRSTHRHSGTVRHPGESRNPVKRLATCPAGSRLAPG